MNNEKEKENEGKQSSSSSKQKLKLEKPPLTRPPEQVVRDSFEVTVVATVQTETEPLARAAVIKLLTSPRYVSPIDGSVNTLEDARVVAVNSVTLRPAPPFEPPGNGESHPSSSSSSSSATRKKDKDDDKDDDDKDKDSPHRQQQKKSKRD